MHKIKILIVTFLFSIMACATAMAQVENDKVINKIIEIAQNDNQTMDHINVLCNRFGGRPIASDAYDNAADWCEYMFKKWGLEVIRQEVGELPVGFNRGPWFGRMIGGNNMTLHFTTPSYTSGTVGVQRGHVVKEPKTEYQFERMKKLLKELGFLSLAKVQEGQLTIQMKEMLKGQKQLKKNVQMSLQLSIRKW